VFDILAVYDELVTLLNSLTGMQKVYEGVPEAFGRSVTAYIAITGQDISDRATGLLRLESSYFIGLGYKTKGAERDAERNLGEALKDFIYKFYALRRTKCNGKADDIRLNMSVASAPEYQVVAGQEYRVYPIIVTAVQTDNTP
jgi:hypothetical protein